MSVSQTLTPKDIGKKTKIMAFTGMDPIRLRILVNNKIIEQNEVTIF